MADGVMLEYATEVSYMAVAVARMRNSISTHHFQLSRKGCVARPLKLTDGKWLLVQ